MVPEKTAEEIEAEKVKAAEIEAAKKADDEKRNKEDPRVAEARDEAIKERKKRQDTEKELADAKKLLKDAEDADLKKKGDLEGLVKKLEGDLEKATNSATQKNSALEKRVIQTELKVLAQAAGIIDPRDVALADLKDVKLDGDDVSGAKEAIEALKKDRPHLFKPVESDKDKAAREKREADEKAKGKGRAAVPPEGGAGDDKKKSAMDMDDKEYAEAKRNSPAWKNVI